MSRTTLESLLEMLDSNKTPEIEQITSINPIEPEQNKVTQKLDKVDEQVLAVFASLERLHENVNQLSTRTHVTTASIERLYEKVVELNARTNKTAASIDQWQQRVYELNLPAQEPVPHVLEPPPEPDPEHESERASHLEPDLAPDPAPNPVSEISCPVDAQSQTQANTTDCDHLSLYMMPSDDMNDFLLAKAPGVSSVHTSTVESAHSPDNLLESTDIDATISTIQPYVVDMHPIELTDNIGDSYIVRIRDEAELVEQAE